MPPLIFTSASYLREAMTTLFFTMFVYYLLQFGLAKGVRWQTLTMALLSSLIAALLHGAFILLPAFLFVYMIAKLINNAPSSRSVLSYSLLAVTMVGVFYLFSSFGVGASKAGILYSNSSGAIQSGLMRVISRGMMMEHMDVLSGSSALFFMFATFKFLFSPFFAGELRSFDLVRWPLVCYFFFCLWGILRGLLPYPFSKIQVSFLIVFGLIASYCFLFSIGSLDPDTAFRHYLKLVPVIVAAGAPMSFLFSRRTDLRGSCSSRDRQRATESCFGDSGIESPGR
jgi:hypothetical protein